MDQTSKTHKLSLEIITQCLLPAATFLLSSTRLGFYKNTIYHTKIVSTDSNEIIILGWGEWLYFHCGPDNILKQLYFFKVQKLKAHHCL